MPCAMRREFTATMCGSAGLVISTLSVTSQANAQAALGTLDTSLQTITTGLAEFGASKSNLSIAGDANLMFATDLDAAKSQIMDADFAEETANFAKFNILNQSNVAMLSQANSTPGLVLQLLKG